MIHLMQMHGLTLDERIDSENTSNNAVTSGCEYEAIKDSLHEDNSQDVIINTTSNALSIPTVLPVSLDDLGEFVLKCHKNENDIFIDQFQVSELLTNNIICLFCINYCHLYIIVTL